MDELLKQPQGSAVMVMISSIGIVVLSVVCVGIWRPPKYVDALAAGNPSHSAVLITGASRGIGNDMTITLAKRGYTVFGTVRSESSSQALLNQLVNIESTGSAGKIHPIILDVTKEESFASALDSVKKILNDKSNPQLHLVGIVNNAGINPEGDKWKGGSSPPMELADPLLAEQVIQTNVLGTIRTTHTFLPLLNDSGSNNDGDSRSGNVEVVDGRIIMIGSYFGSLSGAIGLPHVYYETSKRALEGFTDGLRRGLAKKGSKVSVSLIKPGNINTDMNDYGEVGPEEVTKNVINALESNRPKHRYYPGKVKGMSSYLVCTIFDILPTWLTDRLV